MTRRRHLLTGLAATLAVPACAAPFDGASQPPAAAGLRTTELAGGIAHAWGLAVLPDGGMLITERGGRMRLWRGGAMADVQGVPPVLAARQAGLFDVVLHPRFAENRWVYLTHAAGDESANRTRLVRAELDGARLVGARTLFEVARPKPGLAHFGARLAWLPDGTLLMSVGDGGNPPISLDGAPIRDQAQNLGSHLGKVLRLDAEGRAAPDNPFAGRAGALPEIWALGLRNVQGLAWDPVRRAVWASDHGARRGDELNLLRAGANHGWPLVTHSLEYSGREITAVRTREGMADPALVWAGTLAPSGLAVVTGTRLPGWRGDVLAGGLQSRDIRRVVVDAQGAVQREESIAVGARVRDVREAPDGALLVLTDEPVGRLLRIEPA